MFRTFFSFIIVILIYTIYRSFVFWDVNIYIYIFVDIKEEVGLGG